MIKSMTGYGRAELEGKCGRVALEVSSINRRYLEIALNLPKELAFLDQELRGLVARYAKRGRIQVHLDFKPNSQDVEFFIDADFARKYLEALRALSEELGVKDEMTLKDILSFREVLSFERSSLSQDQVRETVVAAVIKALEVFSQVRAREGEVLEQDLAQRLTMIELKAREIESLAPLAVRRYEARLRKKIQELFSGMEGNEEKVLREVAVMAERLDITEEIVRFTSHVRQFSDAFASDDAVGRLLDFLIQEMTREINTIASKSSELDISRLTIEIRNELDKMREQIQNIE